MNKELIKHPVIVIALEHYNPLGVLRTLGENGVEPIFIGIKYRARIASCSKYVKEFYQVETLEESYNTVINKYGDYYSKNGFKPILIFSDDDVFAIYDENYEMLKEKFILFNAGKNGRVSKFMFKHEIQNCAKRHGIPVLESIVVKVGEIPEGLKYPIVTKAITPNSEGYKSNFHIIENEQELRAAMNEIKGAEVLIQPYVDKKTEMTFEGFSYNKGKGMFTGIQTYLKYPIKGYYSPLQDVCVPEDKELLKKLNSMLEEIGFEGIWEIEFLVDKNDNLWFLEINFRNSTWSYASTVAGNPLPYLWCEAMISGHCPEPKEFEPFTAMVEPIDFKMRVDKGLCSLPEWLKDFKAAKCTYYYDPNDMGPWKVLCENWEKLK